MTERKRGGGVGCCCRANTSTSSSRSVRLATPNPSIPARLVSASGDGKRFKLLEPLRKKARLSAELSVCNEAIGGGGGCHGCHSMGG